MRTGFPIVLFLLLLSGYQLSAQTGAFDPEIRKFYINLDTVSGNRLLHQRYKPGNAVFIRLTGYREFLDNILHQSKINCDRYYTHSSAWIKSLDRLDEPESFTGAAVAELRLYRAILASQLSDYKTTATELLASSRIVAKHGADFSVADRNKLSGIMGVIFRQVPDPYLKYLSLAGVRPSGFSGFNGLDRFYSAALPGTADRMEGYLLIILAKKELGQDPESAWKFICGEGKPMLDNPLIRYQCALAARKAGDCNTALELLDYRPDGVEKIPFPYWLYQVGRTKLYRGDQAAISYFERFIANPGGDNYRHSALEMAGWSYLLNGKPDKAEQLFQQARLLPPPLCAFDKQALSEISQGTPADPDLLRVRLAFDGGLFSLCIKGCDSLIRYKKMDDGRRGEILYRRARCEQRLGMDESAITSFIGVVALADQIRSYIVPNAALQAANLYKKTGRNEPARKYYQLCLDLNKYGYREGLNREAQAALRDLNR